MKKYYLHVFSCLQCDDRVADTGYRQPDSATQAVLQQQQNFIKDKELSRLIRDRIIADNGSAM